MKKLHGQTRINKESTTTDFFHRLNKDEIGTDKNFFIGPICEFDLWWCSQ